MKIRSNVAGQLHGRRDGRERLGEVGLVLESKWEINFSD